jgi:hypothetical protein
MTMKCISNGVNVRRVDDDEAARAVKQGGWKYCPKSEWKKIRGPVAIQISRDTETKNKYRKSKKRNNTLTPIAPAIEAAPVAPVVEPKAADPLNPALTAATPIASDTPETPKAKKTVKKSEKAATVKSEKVAKAPKTEKASKAAKKSLDKTAEG